MLSVSCTSYGTVYISVLHCFLPFFSTVGYLHNTEPDFELAKYHAELVHGDVEVTLHMLRTKWLEIHKCLGISITDCRRTAYYMTKLLARCRLLRFAKCKGYDTNRKSLLLVKPLLYDIASQEEPVYARSANSVVNAHCTCTPEAKVLSNEFLPEDDESHQSVSQSNASGVMQSSLNGTPDLTNLFATPTLLNLFTVPSTSKSNHTTESSDEEGSSTVSRPTRSYMKEKNNMLCSFCRQKLSQTFKTSAKRRPRESPLRSADYAYSFPELLPERPVAMEQPEHQMVIASEQEPILESDDDDVYSALFYISQNRTR